MPAPKAEWVSRTALVNRLRAAVSCPVLTILAPAGYGKTALLVQWAARDERPFAWVSLDEDDNDPAALLRDIEAALEPVEEVQCPTKPSRSARPTPNDVRRLAWALRSTGRPIVLVLDDIHALGSRESVAIVAELAERMPDGSILVLAGRALPRLRVARLRASGRLLELGLEDMALNRKEGAELLRRAGAELPPEKVSALVEQAEGWPASLYLSALSAGNEAPAGEAEVTRHVTDYVWDEHLGALSEADISFLTRASVLDSMCGDLCDAALETTGSARRLDSLARAHLFLLPLEEEGAWFRYHREFRDVLRAELARREPGAARGLNRRAAAWCASNGAPDTAIAYAHASGDDKLLARLVEPRIHPALSRGDHAAVETWLGWFDDAALGRHPALRALGALAHVLGGRPAAAGRWLAAAAKASEDEAPADGSGSIRPWNSVVGALLCREGPKRALADAKRALRELGPTSRWRPFALLAKAMSCALLGESDRAEALLAEAADEAELVGMTPVRVAALAGRSLLAARRGDEAAAEDLVRRARGLVDEHRLDDDVLTALAFAASARRSLRNGYSDRARADLATVEALRPGLSHALPWYSVQVSLETARAYLAFLDEASARSWLAEAAETLRRRPDLGVLVDEVEAVEDELRGRARARGERASELTPAELRVLPLLATHLSFPEIGERLFISRNTVKSQATSIYRKLGVTSRSDAIERAAELGLVAPAPPPPAEATSPLGGDATPARA